MPGPRDNALVLRDGSSDLTATETLTLTMTGGHPKDRMLAVNVIVPSQSGTSPTLTVTAKFTDTNKKIEVTHTDALSDASTYPKRLIIPLPPTTAASLSVVLTVGGTSPDLGAVQVWLELAEYASVSAA